MFYSQYGLTQHIRQKHHAPSTPPHISPRLASPQITTAAEGCDQLVNDNWQDVDMDFDNSPPFGGPRSGLPQQ